MAEESANASHQKENFDQVNGSHDASSQSAMLVQVKEEPVHEDVLDIAIDKSLVADLEPAALPDSKASRDRGGDKKITVKKERSKDKDEKAAEKQKEKDRVFGFGRHFFFLLYLSLNIIFFALQTVNEKDKVLPLPHSRWEEDSDEESADQSEAKQLDGAGVGADVIKRAENAIFRRAISAIKPKNQVIEIKLRPERRVLIDMANASEADVSASKLELDTAALTDGLKNPSPPAEHHPSNTVVSMRTALSSSAPKLHPSEIKVESDDKKKSIRDRLGDKIQPEQQQQVQVKSEGKEKTSKKERRSSPNAKDKDKVID